MPSETLQRQQEEEKKKRKAEEKKNKSAGSYSEFVPGKGLVTKNLPTQNQTPVQTQTNTKMPSFNSTEPKKPEKTKGIYTYQPGESTVNIGKNVGKSVMDSWSDFLHNVQYGKGNIDLHNRPLYTNEDGSVSTVRSMNFYDDKDKKETLIPTIVNGKKVSDEEAIDHYYKTGEYLGKFDTVEDSNKYAEWLHMQQEKRYGLEPKATYQPVNEGAPVNQKRYMDYKDKGKGAGCRR